MANSITFNSTDLSTYGLTVLGGDWTDWPAMDERAQPLAQHDGLVGAPRLYRQRTIRLACVIVASGMTQLKAYIDSIKAVLWEREACAATLDLQPDRYWMARASLDGCDIVGPTTAEATLVLYCLYPFAYASSESEHEETSIDVGVEGESYTVTAGGTVPAYPMIVFEASGTSTTLIIEHDDLDTRLQYTGGLESGDKLRIKCEPSEWLVEKMPSGEDAYSEVMTDINGQWPYLEVGDNVFTVYDFEGDITWTWRDRYL